MLKILNQELQDSYSNRLKTSMEHIQLTVFSHNISMIVIASVLVGLMVCFLLIGGFLQITGHHLTWQKQNQHPKSMEDRFEEIKRTCNSRNEPVKVSFHFFMQAF